GQARRHRPRRHRRLALSARQPSPPDIPRLRQQQGRRHRVRRGRGRVARGPFDSLRRTRTVGRLPARRHLGTRAPGRAPSRPRHAPLRGPPMMTAHRTRDATLLLASTLTVMAGATIAPALPEMERAYAEHEHAKLLVQLVMTLPGLLIALGAPVVGWLLDRGPRRPVLLVAMVLYALAGTSPLVLDGLTAILVGRALLGLAVAAIMVTCTTLVGDYFEGPQRGHAMGLLAAFGGFGGVVFVALGSALAGLHWRAPFALYGLAFLLVPAILAFLPEPTRPTVARPRGRGARISPVFLLGCCGLAILEILALYMVPVHVPFFAQDARIDRKSVAE